MQVSDASSPVSAEQDAQVESVLKELEADKKPRLRVMNKIDLLPPKQRESLRDDEHNQSTFRRRRISALERCSNASMRCSKKIARSGFACASRKKKGKRCLS